MFHVLVTFFASAVVVDLAGYWLHRWAHVPGSPLYRRHMTHHLVNYPARRFLSNREYLSSGSDSLAIWFAPFLVVYVVAVGFVVGWPLCLAAWAGAVPVAVAESLTHDSTHVSGSRMWMGDDGYLRGLAHAHYAHHRKMTRNFGVVTLVWDRIFGTFWGSRKDPPPAR